MDERQDRRTGNGLAIGFGMAMALRYFLRERRPSWAGVIDGVAWYAAASLLRQVIPTRRAGRTAGE